MFFEFLLLHFVFVAVPASVIFEDCGSAYDLQSVHIEGCGRSLPCHVTLGEQTPVRVQFVPDFSSTQLEQDVVININLVNMDAEVNPDPCNIVDCPVKPNAASSFTSIMTVPPRMALNRRGYLRWRVYNESRQLVICYSVLVQTQSVLQKQLRAALLPLMPDEANQIVDSLYLGELDQSDAEASQALLQQLTNHYYMKGKYGSSRTIKYRY